MMSNSQENSRFDKFKSTKLDRMLQGDNDNPVTSTRRYDLKRKRPLIEESPQPVSFKRPCNDFNGVSKLQSPQAPPKNMANARLQRIKEKFKNDSVQTSNLDSRNPEKTISKNVNVPDLKLTDKSLVHPSKFATSQAVIQNESNIDSESLTNEKEFIKPKSSQNIYRNIAKWASPPNSTPNRNFANSRLEKIKKYVLTPPKNSLGLDKCDKINNNDSKGEQDNLHCSPLLAGIKRSASTTDNCSLSKKMALHNETTDTDITIQPSLFNSPDLSKVSKLVSVEFVQKCETQSETNKSPPHDIFNKLSPINTSICNSNDLLNISKQFAVETMLDINDSTHHTFNKSLSVPTSVSKASLCQNMTLNGEKMSKEVMPTIKTLNCIPESVSEASSLKAENVNTSDQHTNFSVSNFKQPHISSKSPKSSKSPSITDTLSTEPGDSFSARMERTALWVRNTLSNSSYCQEEKTDPSKSLERPPQNQSSLDAVDTEEMEWTNAEPDEEVTTTKTEKIENDEDMLSSPKVKSQKTNNLCIVVDTNIFISNLSKLKDILDISIPGSSALFLYIPWMVIEELDYMKDRCSDSRLKRNIMKSTKFINEALSKENRRVIGQTVEEASIQKHIGTSQDDKIIACCLQVAEKYEDVILLSNDMNLKNKALINSIAVCSGHEIIMKIMSKFIKGNKSKRILQKMSILCSSIICECAKDTYGDVWSKMDMLSCPPWPLIECLKRFKKYWNSVFQDRLMKQFTKNVDDLLLLLQKHICFSDDSQEYIKFVKMCISLCVFLKDIEDCRGSVETTLRDITKIG